MRGSELECVALALPCLGDLASESTTPRLATSAQIRIATEQRSNAPCALVIVLEVFGKLKATGFEEA